jgi:hypothetical protein
MCVDSMRLEALLTTIPILPDGVAWRGMTSGRGQIAVHDGGGARRREGGHRLEDSVGGGGWGDLANRLGAAHNRVEDVRVGLTKVHCNGGGHTAVVVAWLAPDETEAVGLGSLGPRLQRAPRLPVKLFKEAPRDQELVSRG